MSQVETLNVPKIYRQQYFYDPMIHGMKRQKKANAIGQTCAHILVQCVSNSCHTGQRVWVQMQLAPNFICMVWYTSGQLKLQSLQNIS